MRRARRLDRQWLAHQSRRKSAAPTDRMMPTPDATVEVIVIWVRPDLSRLSGECTTTRSGKAPDVRAFTGTASVVVRLRRGARGSRCGAGRGPGSG